MEAGIETTFLDEWIVSLIDARAPKPRRPKTYRKHSARVEVWTHGRGHDHDVVT